MKLNITNETGKLRSVVLGQPNSMGADPTLDEAYDAKSYHTIQHGTYPKENDIIREMTKDFADWEKKRKMAPKIHHFKATLKNMERNEMHNIHRKHRYIEVDDMQLSDKMIQKITNRFAKYMIDNPWKAEEISKLMHEILVEQPNKEFNEKH